MRERKPILGYVDRGGSKERRAFTAFAPFLPLSVLWIVFCLNHGMNLLHRGDTVIGGLLDAVIGVLFLAVGACHVVLGFFFWRLHIALTKPGWQGDRWFQPKKAAGAQADDDGAA